MADCARIRRSLCVCLGMLIAYYTDVAAGTQPNIVFILADDMGYSNTGFSAALNNRSTQFQTPNLDALAQQGVVASQYYVGHSLCGPSRYDLLTGLYSQRQGYENNIAEWGYQAVNGNITQGVTPDVTMLPARLQSLGYSTGMIGKWHEGYQQGLNTPMDKGFQEYFGFNGGGRSYYGYGTVPDTDHGIWKNNQYYESQWQTEGDHSLYDPTKGRYLTDAFGEEAASYINRHAADSNPFFLYMAVNAPHEPYDVKQSDYNHFANIADTNTRTLAAMTYAMDRSVGMVMNALQTDGIADNTIVIFTNDNGAPAFTSAPNAPFNGNKGTMYEGGIRTPFIIKGPGITPGVYNSPITAYDMVPTLVSAGGGDISQFQHDGYDVMPYIKGQATDDPNKAHFWRNFNSYAVRKGDWKLTMMYQGYNNRALFNIANNPQENVFLSNASVVADLSNELTKWEATLEKPKWGDLGAWNQNLFDHFVFRNDQAATSNWSTANLWTQSGTTNIATLNPADAYANAVIEFTTRDDADYTANNDMKRMSRETFMLNQFQLTGNFNGAASHQGSITGNAVLMVKDLTGQLPQIRLDATSNGQGAGFTFNMSNEIQLLDDLQITGNGTQQFVLSGSLRDYYESNAPTNPNITRPHNVTKTGNSQLVLAGSSTFGGTFTINGGQVRVDGPSATISGPTKITIANGALLELDNGSITVPTIDNVAGGIAHLYGGTLKSPNITGNLVNDGGTLAPAATPAIRKIGGSLDENDGTLQMLINSATSFDRLQIGTTADLGGTLLVQLGNGYSPALNQIFQILTAPSGITGTFANLLLPALSAGKTWQLLYGANDVRLTVAAIVGITGDYNQNGIVDAGDYVVWRKSLGSTTKLAADGNHNGVIDQADYDIWRQRLGSTSGGLGSGSNAVVPEPNTVVSLLIAGGSVLPLRHRRRVA